MSDNSDPNRRVFKASASGTSGNIALMIFFLAAAITIVGVCWAGAWMVRK